MHLAGATWSLYAKPVGIALPQIEIRHMRIPTRGIICGGGGRAWHIADSMQDAAYRITDADADDILADRAHFREVVVWSIRAIINYIL